MRNVVTLAAIVIAVSLASCAGPSRDRTAGVESARIVDRSRDAEAELPAQNDMRARIRGRVVHACGDPIGGVEIELRWSGRLNARHPVERDELHVTTGADGVFVLEIVPQEDASFELEARTGSIALERSIDHVDARAYVDLGDLVLTRDA